MRKLEDKARRAVADKASAAQRQKAVATSAPILDCLVPAELNSIGIGNLVFSRALPDGRVAMAVFLLDIFCLGVKNATYATLEADVHAQHVEALRETGSFVVVAPAYFRKLVEGGVAYAKDLGFAPHPDYAVARQIFGLVDTALCEQEFLYGQNGKPYYVAGPRETLSQSRAIVEQLQRRQGGGDYLVPLAGPTVG